jgi:hypothetical protein
MPRTAVFMEALPGAFGENVCPIRFDTADKLQGVVARVDGYAQPWELSSLMQWRNVNPTNPLDRQPLDLQTIHPVLTPDVDPQVYERALIALVQRGWQGIHEVEADIEALRAYENRSQRKSQKKRGAEEPLPGVVAALRATEARCMWGRFKNTRRANGLDQARFELDLCLCDDAFTSLRFQCTTRTRHLVRAFLTQRFRAWSMGTSPNPVPIWMGLNRLYDDFMKLYAHYFHAAPPIESKTRVLGLMLAWADRQPELVDIAHWGPNNDETLLVIGMAPYRLAYLLADASDEDRAWLRAPHVFHFDIAHRLRDMELHRFPHHADGGLLRLELSSEKLHAVVQQSFALIEYDTYALQLEAPPPWPQQARVPFDPYTSEQTLAALRDGLYAMEAEQREVDH